MRRSLVSAAVAALVAVLLTACGSGGSSSTAGDTGSSPPSPSHRTQPARTRNTAPSGPSTAAATALDPCQLVTASEASALAGTTYAHGLEKPTGTGGTECVYGYQTTNVFTVLVAQAPDAATAQSTWDTEVARAQTAITTRLPPALASSLHVGGVPGLGDRAAAATFTKTIAGQTISISAIYVLQGSTFLTFSDLVLGKAAPSVDALKAQAQTSLGRI